MFAFRDRSHDFAATKANVPLAECKFLLDFNRPLQRLHWLDGINKWVGPVVGLLVPVVHQSEQAGGYLISVHRGEPYYADIPTLWKSHAGAKRTLFAPSVDGLEVVADFGRHFPEDCR